MKFAVIFFMMLCNSVVAESFLEMLCARNDMELPRAIVCRPVKDNAEALQRVSELSTNIFAGVQWVAVLHSSDKFGVWHVESIGSSTATAKIDTAKHLLIFEVVKANTFGITYCLPISTKTDSDTKEALIKSDYPDKTFITTKSPEASK